MKLLLLGCTGPSGRALITESLNRNHKITIYARSPHKLDEALRTNPEITIVQGDMTDGTKLREALRGQDAVLSFLSPVPNQATDHVIADAFHVLFRAMKEERVTRFVGTGTPSYKDPRDKTSWTLWFAISLIRWFLPNVYRDVVAYSGYVAQETEIEWSWFRLMWVNDKPKTGKVLCGYDGDGRMSFGGIRRGDLAEVMLDEITERKWVKQMPILRTV
jgi:hypothetical protein